MQMEITSKARIGESTVGLWGLGKAEFWRPRKYLPFISSHLSFTGGARRTLGALMNFPARISGRFPLLSPRLQIPR